MKKQRPKQEFLPTGTDQSAIITYGGSYEGDHEMPLYTNHEFNAAFDYLKLLGTITEARKQGRENIKLEDKTIRLPIAEKMRDDLKKEFYAITATESRLENPSATDKYIRNRAHDTLASILDTGYIREGRDR